MKKTIGTVLAVSALTAFLSPAWAASLGCPDLAQATQVGACPSEEELQYTFTGYCSDDNKAYRGETDVCTDYQRYRTFKNVALWESADGRFNGYVSCAQPPAAVRAAPAQTMQLLPQGKMNRLVCSYPQGLVFTHRTRAHCVVEAAACAANGSGCKATCE